MLPEILYDLQVNHTRPNPVFIIGNARSGTSLLLKLIRKYLKISFGTESQFIIRYYKNLDKYGDLNDDENLLWLINDISQERCFSRWKKRFDFELDAGSIFYDIREKSYRGVLEAFFMQLARYHQMDRWGDKTPEYNLNLPVLAEIFPDAQFIHIVRDGRDVALSNRKTHFGNKNLYLQALDWKANLSLIDEFLKSLLKDRYTEIKYEEFITNPVPVFLHLIEFLGIEDKYCDLLSFIGKHVQDDLRDDNCFKWKKKLSKRQVKAFEKLTGDMLRKYEYEANASGIWKPNFLTRLVWHVDSKIKKSLMRDYWSDNWNKLKSRIKETAYPLRKLTPHAGVEKPAGRSQRKAMQEFS